MLWSAATIANGVAYFTSFDDKVYAVNAHTGNLLWTFPMSEASDSTPSVVNGTVFVGSEDGNVYALEASSGALKWSAAVSGGVIIGQASLANGVVYVGGFGGKIYGLDIKTGEELWSAETQSGIFSTPAVANGVVYLTAADDNLYAFALDGGAHPAYNTKRPRPSYASLHPDRRLKFAR